METSDFQPIFSKFVALASLFKGCFSADTTPSSLRLHEFFIANTEPSNSFGRHWVCFVKTSKAGIEAFNSLGFDAESKKLFENICLKINGITKVFHNSTRVQSLTSTTCGHFCVYFLIERLFNIDLSFEELLNEIFVESIDMNEKRVELFFTEVVHGEK